MNTLKNLTKSIDNWDGTFCISDNGKTKAPEDTLFAWNQDLRQSAIEWAKEMEKQRIKEIESIKNIVDEFSVLATCTRWKRGNLMDAITWIEHFFNITEDDLK